MKMSFKFQVSGFKFGGVSALSWGSAVFSDLKLETWNLKRNEPYSGRGV